MNQNGNGLPAPAGVPIPAAYAAIAGMNPMLVRWNAWARETVRTALEMTASTGEPVNETHVHANLVGIIASVGHARLTTKQLNESCHQLDGRDFSLLTEAVCGWAAKRLREHAETDHRPRLVT